MQPGCCSSFQEENKHIPQNFRLILQIVDCKHPSHADSLIQLSPTVLAAVLLTVSLLCKEGLVVTFRDRSNIKIKW